jgi:hypothetical protein
MPNIIEVGTQIYDIPFSMYARVTAIAPAYDGNAAQYLLDGSEPVCANYPTRWRSQYEITTAIIYSTPQNSVSA